MQQPAPRGLLFLRVFRGASVLAMAAALVLVAQVAFAATPVPVLARKNVAESQPSASANYLVWTQNSVAHPRHYNTYARAPGQGTIRINEAGTSSFQAAIDGTSVLYSSGSHGLDLRLYDLSTGDRTRPGKGVNTRYIEFQPNITEDHFFFARGKFNGATRWVRLILYDRATGRSTVLAEVDTRHGFLDSDQVNGDWLVWEYCRLAQEQFSECDVFRYQISTRETVRLPNPGKQQYSPAVTSDGTVYFGRSGSSVYWKCGANAKLIRYPLGGPGTVIASLPRGTDEFASFALEEQYGLVTLYFDEIQCDERTSASDIYKLADFPGA